MLVNFLKSLLARSPARKVEEPAAAFGRQLHLLSQLAQQGRAAATRQLIQEMSAPQRRQPVVRFYELQANAASPDAPEYRRGLRDLIESSPDLVPALVELGSTELRADNYPEAAQLLARAAEIQPDEPSLLNNLGLALLKDQRLAAAAAIFDKAIRLNDSFAWAHVALGNVLLCLGQFDRGWAEYERRHLVTERIAFGQIPLPGWDGASLAGKRLLAVAEQGFGDTIWAARFLRRMRERGVDVTVAAQSALVRYLRQNDLAGEIIEAGEIAQKLDTFAAKCALLELPRLLEIAADELPCGTSYLVPAQADIERWRPRFAASRRPLVGLAWRGSATQDNDRNRSLALDRLMPVVEAGQGHFVNLQIDSLPHEKAMWKMRISGEDPAGEIVDFCDTAAIVACLDVIVTVDTAVAHLAGAMGSKVFLLRPNLPDWRWQVAGVSSPWYPSVRVFQQVPFGRWEPAIAEVARHIAELRQA